MQLRIAQLEEELAVANETISRLKGYVDERASDDMAEALTAEQFHTKRELDVRLSDAGMEAIAAMLRRRFQGSVVSMVGSTLHCKWHNATLEVARHAERTELRITANEPDNKLLLALGGMGLAVLVGPLISAPLLALGVPPAAFIGLVPWMLVASYLAMSALTRRTMRNHRQKLIGAFEAAVELARERGEQGPPLRIAVEEDAAATSEAAAGEAAGIREAAAAAAEAEAAAAAEGAIPRVVEGIVMEDQ